MDLPIIAASIWSDYVYVNGYRVYQQLEWLTILEAKSFKEEIAFKYKFHLFLSKDQAYTLYDIKDIDKQVASLNKSIENSQIMIFKNFQDKTKVASEKKSIQVTLNKIAELESKRHFSLLLTFDGKISNLYEDFLFKKRVKNTSFPKLLSNKDLEVIKRDYLNSLPSITDIRKLARSNWYQSLYPVQDINTNKCYSLCQSNLISYVSFYKSINEIIENKPSSEIINDDDAIDGWLLSRNTSSNVESTLNKHLGKQEVFLFPKNEQEHRDIIISQTSEEQEKKNHRMNLLAKQGIWKHEAKQ